MSFYGLLLKTIVTKGRLIALFIAGGACIALAPVVRPEGAVDLSIVLAVGFGLYLPVVALVFGAAVIGDLNEESTLHYFWMRPVGRVKLSLIAFFAALTPTVFFAVPVLALITVAGGGDIDAVFAALGGAAAGSIAFVAAFTLLGALFKRALIFGLVYVFIWESLVAANVEPASRVSIGRYARDTFLNVVPVQGGAPLYSSNVAFGVSIAIALVFVALSALRLRRMDID